MDRLEKRQVDLLNPNHFTCLLSEIIFTNTSVKICILLDLTKTKCLLQM